MTALRGAMYSDEKDGGGGRCLPAEGIVRTFTPKLRRKVEVSPAATPTPKQMLSSSSHCCQQSHHTRMPVAKRTFEPLPPPPPRPFPPTNDTGLLWSFPGACLRPPPPPFFFFPRPPGPPSSSLLPS